MRRAKEDDARQVERLYSAKPVRVRVGKREYVLPRNFLGPKGLNESDFLDYRYLPFTLFLPDYEGFTKSNWQEGPFHEQRIDIIQLKPVDKTALVPIAGGGKRIVQPAGYGEPRARFKNLRALLEERPSLHLFGLDGYRRKNHPRVRTVTWTGARANGEFFFFDSTFAPGEDPPPSARYPSCQAQYYSELEDQYIVYRYKQVHLERWKEIDTAIWRKINGWLVT